ncbi:MAG TPA: lysophospholipid acyltransferase family protein [Candidatus Acidoferrales bacterium]|jgi:1-acyl-sn-glycerol-3-phosphate acyltransferase|nr:lysophospholipid acyltransferase family protein [Candidatus Acidoferrales bacterium]
MNPSCRHLFRIVCGLGWFIDVVVVALADYVFSCAFNHKQPKPLTRAQWLQRHSRRALKIFDIRMSVSGPVPAAGLVVSNHVSYLDVLVISSITPALFVAKREIKFWPVIGWLTQMAGTVFIDRQRRTQVGQVNSQIQATLNSGALVVLFPEGTSSDGRTVLPFKSALFEPVASRTHNVTIGFVQYALDDGDATSEICYWGNHTFFPHLLNLMGHRGIRVAVRFAPFNPSTSDRKELARLSHAEILKLKELPWKD